MNSHVLYMVISWPQQPHDHAHTLRQQHANNLLACVQRMAPGSAAIRCRLFIFRALRPVRKLARTSCSDGLGSQLRPHNQPKNENKIFGSIRQYQARLAMFWNRTKVYIWYAPWDSLRRHTKQMMSITRVRVFRLLGLRFRVRGEKTHGFLKNGIPLLLQVLKRIAVECCPFCSCIKRS